MCCISAYLLSCCIPESPHRLSPLWTPNSCRMTYSVGRGLHVQLNSSIRALHDGCSQRAGLGLAVTWLSLSTTSPSYLVDWPIIQSISHSTVSHHESIKQSIDQSINQSIKQSTNQSIGPPPINQSLNQLTIQDEIEKMRQIETEKDDGWYEYKWLNSKNLVIMRYESTLWQ